MCTNFWVSKISAQIFAQLFAQIFRLKNIRANFCAIICSNFLVETIPSVMKFGMQESELISWTAWHHAYVEFFTNVLTINEKDAFQCTDCGPRPKVLVIDGIAMGIQKGELEKHKDIVVKDLPRKSKKEFSGSCFQDRMFIKLPKNRKLLKSAAQKEEWPVLCSTVIQSLTIIMKLRWPKKRPKLEHDDGMEKFCLFLRTFDRSIKPSRNCLTIMESNNSDNSNNTGI